VLVEQRAALTQPQEVAEAIQFLEQLLQLVVAAVDE
jgi:hypothetical protein